MSKEEYESTKIILHSLVITAVKGCTERQLNADYSELEATPIPFLKLGFASLLDLIYSMSDVLVVRNFFGLITIEAKATKETAHVKNFVMGQKRTSSSKYPGGSRLSRQENAPRRGRGRFGSRRRSGTPFSSNVYQSQQMNWQSRSCSVPPPFTYTRQENRMHSYNDVPKPFSQMPKKRMPLLSYPKPVQNTSNRIVIKTARITVPEGFKPSIFQSDNNNNEAYTSNSVSGRSAIPVKKKDYINEFRSSASFKPASTDRNTSNAYDKYPCIKFVKEEPNLFEHENTTEPSDYSDNEFESNLDSIPEYSFKKDNIANENAYLSDGDVRHLISIKKEPSDNEEENETNKFANDYNQHDDRVCEPRKDDEKLVQNVNSTDFTSQAENINVYAASIEPTTKINSEKRIDMLKAMKQLVNKVPDFLKNTYEIENLSDKGNDNVVSSNGARVIYYGKMDASSRDKLTTMMNSSFIDAKGNKEPSYNKIAQTVTNSTPTNEEVFSGHSTKTGNGSHTLYYSSMDTNSRLNIIRSLNESMSSNASPISQPIRTPNRSFSVDQTNMSSASRTVVGSLQEQMVQEGLAKDNSSLLHDEKSGRFSSTPNASNVQSSPANVNPRREGRSSSTRVAALHDLMSKIRNLKLGA